MHSKNHKPLTKAEREHLAKVKALPCSVCDQEAPSEAHHIKQGQHWTVVALCKDCHGGPGYPLGWHGQKMLWKLKKWDEIDALAVTIERLMK